MVVRGGVEPPTPRSSGTRYDANRANYGELSRLAVAENIVGWMVSGGGSASGGLVASALMPAMRASGPHFVGEPLSRSLPRDTERDRDLVPRPAVSPCEPDGLPQPCLVITDGLRSLGDPAKVVGCQHPGRLGLELLGQLLEAFCRALDLLVCVSHLHDSLREESVEPASQRHRVDGDWIVAFDVEDTDLQQCAVGRRSDQHRQVVFHFDPAHGVANSVQDVGVGDAMLAGRLTYPHVDNLSCLRSGSTTIGQPPGLVAGPGAVPSVENLRWCRDPLWARSVNQPSAAARSSGSASRVGWVAANEAPWCWKRTWKVPEGSCGIPWRVLAVAGSAGHRTPGATSADRVIHRAGVTLRTLRAVGADLDPQPPNEP